VDLRVDVGGGQHRPHPWQSQGHRRVDALDARPGERAAHETGMQHARADDVVDERAMAGEQAGVLDAGHPGAYVSHVYRSNPKAESVVIVLR